MNSVHLLNLIAALWSIINTLCNEQLLDSIVVSISACHVEGPGSIPGRGGDFFSCASYDLR